MTKFVTRIATLGAAIVVLACGRGTGPEGSALVGEWEKLERSLPPVHLLISRDGDVLRARMRLSGTESHGTMTVDGSRVTLHFPGDLTITGDLLSSRELRLNMDLPAQTRLRKLTR